MSSTPIKVVRLSPSRMNSVEDCSWQYYGNYHIKLPQSSNDGNRRGNIVHDFLECLVVPRHQHYVKEISDADDPFALPAPRRMLEGLAKKNGLVLDQQVVNLKKDGLMTHREEIIKMLLLALRSDFLGKPGDEILSEIEHTITVNEGGKLFALKGIIDKVFIRRNAAGEIEEVEIHDYKTSSIKFDKKTIDSNVQGLVYQYFARKLYPTAKRIIFKFLFLRFPKDPWIEVPTFPERSFEGFEYFLTYVADYMNKFTEAHAVANMAKSNGTIFLCGQYGNKTYKVKGEKIEHNEPKFLCAIRDPFEYYAIIDKDGANVKSDMKRENLRPKEGEKIVKRKYFGCPAHHAQPKNVKEQFHI